MSYAHFSQVHLCLPQETAYTGNPPVMCANGKKPVGVSTASHGAEFQNPERLAAFPYPFLDKETASLTVCLYDQADYHEKREQYDDSQCGEDDV